MSSVGLLQPILDGGIRTTTFFNGRLLTGEDLTAEQQAAQQAHALLGSALGDGIVWGLQVGGSVTSTPRSPSITVFAGLAVNRLGQVLALNAPATGVEVTLVRPTPPGTPAGITRAGFVDRLPPQAGVYVAGTLAYLLVIAPASGSEGLAPTSGLNGIAPTCATRYTVEGVQFRLVQMDVASSVLNDQAHLRNLLAHLCFGTSDDRLQVLHRDPFGPNVDGSSYGAVDQLRASGLVTDADVPLAVIHWTDAGAVEFVDMWSARRRLVRRATVPEWLTGAQDRRLAEGEAMLAQFQAQLLDVRLGNTSPQSVAATDVYRFLPPVGLVPISAIGFAPAFDAQRFFGSTVTRGPAVLDAASMDAVVHMALHYAPIDLQNPAPVWLYRIRENWPLPGATPSPAPYLLFTTGHVPFMGRAGFDLGRWDYGAYE
ncbi:MAG TPA: hypothetical protein VGJ60_19630 [Chloroflexota bacterium]